SLPGIAAWLGGGGSPSRPGLWRWVAACWLQPWGWVAGLWLTSTGLASQEFRRARQASQVRPARCRVLAVWQDKRLAGGINRDSGRSGSPYPRLVSKPD